MDVSHKTFSHWLPIQLKLSSLEIGLAGFFFSKCKEVGCEHSITLFTLLKDFYVSEIEAINCFKGKLSRLIFINKPATCALCALSENICRWS